jgi:hypothetical protein
MDFNGITQSHSPAFASKVFQPRKAQKAQSISADFALLCLFAA